jgi:hypothetical protein
MHSKKKVNIRMCNSCANIPFLAFSTLPMFHVSDKDNTVLIALLFKNRRDLPRILQLYSVAFPVSPWYTASENRERSIVGGTKGKAEVRAEGFHL